jgi:TP901 family phage tail tape measure protein
MAELRFEVLFQAIDRMSAQLDHISKGFGGLNEEVKRTEHLKHVGEIAVGVGAAIGGAGAVGALAIKGMVEAAEDFENHIGRLGAAMGNIPDKAAMLAKAEEWVKKTSIETGYGVDDLSESLYQGLSGFLNLNQSMAVAAESAKLARGTQGDLAETTKLMTTMMLNFSDAQKSASQNATILADKLAALQTQYKFTSLEDLTEAMKYAAPVAMAYKISLDQTAGALAALSAAGKTGGEAGTAYLEVVGQLVKKAPKLGIHIDYTSTGELDLFKTLDEVQKKFGSRAAREMLTQELGLRAGPALQLILQHMDKFKTATDGVAHSTGAATTAEQNFEERGTLAWQKVAAAIHVVWIDLGEALAPTLAKVAKKLADVGMAVHDFIAAHPQLAKYVMIFGAIGAAVALVGGALIALAGGLLIATSFMGAFDVAATIALGGLPIVIAAIAAGAYEIYKHWAGIKTFFGEIGAALVKFWDIIKPENLFGKLIPDFFSWGAKLVKTFAQGLLSVMNYPAEAVEKIMHKVASYLPGHSPAEVGPLSMLDRMPFSETFAQSIKPAPVIHAVSNLAGALRVAMPTLVPPMGQAARGGSGTGGGQVIIHYQPKVTVNGAGGSPDDWVKAMRRHGDELVRIVKENAFREARLRFDEG